MSTLSDLGDALTRTTSVPICVLLIVCVLAFVGFVFIVACLCDAWDERGQRGRR